MTTTFTVVPEAADGVKTQPWAVPMFEKSPDAIPDTDSENVRPKVCVMPDAGEPGVDVNETVGAVTSTVIVDAAVFDTGPFCWVD